MKRECKKYNRINTPRSRTSISHNVCAPAPYNVACKLYVNASLLDIVTRNFCNSYQIGFVFVFVFVSASFCFMFISINSSAIDTTHYMCASVCLWILCNTLCMGVCVSEQGDKLHRKENFNKKRYKVPCITTTHVQTHTHNRFSALLFQ